MIEVLCIWSSLPRPQAVSDVTFKVEKGEILGFLAPTAPGKTTTMRMIHGRAAATSARCRWPGFRRVRASHGGQAAIGYLSFERRPFPIPDS